MRDELYWTRRFLRLFIDYWVTTSLDGTIVFFSGEQDRPLALTFDDGNVVITDELQATMKRAHWEEGD